MKAFISYDSRDRNRFVEEFAEKLMSKAIDIWYDEWELEYGDSLVRIFDEIVKCDILSALFLNTVLILIGLKKNVILLL